ncbi:MAG: FAD-dependent oxidoreductase [Verrucomicrobia bacterium]|nr:FAD-dependent oxidoreductase [Verrucomicrobiota bacterium]
MSPISDRQLRHPENYGNLAFVVKSVCRSLSLVLAICLAASAAQTAPNIVESDICVYGGTSGGVVAAVAAARLGKSVVLLTQNNHVGGMTASGLGVTDIGPGNDTSYVGGISREFYRRVGQAYGSGNLVLWFEPHVAEMLFGQMLAEAGVPVYPNQLLATATLVSNRITQITMEDGSVFRAKQFIDTSYEGDLMAAAGVSFTWGREGTNVYNETLAGIRALGGAYSYDPYVIPGSPASGLLPLVGTNTGGRVGDGDQRLQAYNFRLCLTQNATNKIAITAPTNYSAANYELVRRYITNRLAVNGSVTLANVIDIQTIIPNGKTDINARDELSTDYIGYNYTWATNTHAGRATLRQQHEDYIRGLLYFYATSTNLPANLNTEAQSWGLAKDEFKDTGGWPWQIYVREARRMVSDYVMTQANCESRITAPDGICLARYQIDSHGVQRLAAGNFSRWEGSIGGTPPYPYPISYRALIPKTGECQNVFATFALSASHVAFASCRMEPVFMMTSHAAGVAAAFAIDDNVPVQQLNPAKLAAQLRADGQLLSWTAATAATNGIIMDETDPGTANSGGWSSGANAGGLNGDYLLDGATAKGQRWVRYTPTLPTNGTYEVYLWWVESSNRATNTPVDVIHSAGTNRVLLNQKVSSGGWFKIMTTNFTAGTSGSVIIRNDNTAVGAYCVADGVRFFGIGGAAVTPPPPTIEVVASDAAAGEYPTNPARFSFVRSGDTNPTVTINYTVNGTATPGVDYAMLPGSIVLQAGATATNLLVSPIPDALAEGEETVTLTLQTSLNYTLSPVSNATVALHDQPVDGWRVASFTATELNDPRVSSDLADPDQDGLANLMEYALGLLPKTANPNPFAPRMENDHFTLTYTRLKTATDVILSLETSTDLGSWQANPALFEQVASIDEDSVERITVRLAVTASASITSYVRLRVTRF